MYHVRCKTNEEAVRVQAVLSSFLSLSRFTARLVVDGKRVNLETVRLRVGKDYCGNHPGPCKVSGRDHRVFKYLEGLDWVSFNDMVNDALDSIWHSGNAGSSFCSVRKTGRRRVSYYMTERDDWEKIGETWEYEDWRGQVAPASEYPSGTPGIPGWRAA
jgi:hypothetical protein